MVLRSFDDGDDRVEVRGLGGGMGMSMRLGMIGLVTVGVAKTSSGSVRMRSSISMSSAVTPMRTSSEKERCWFLSYWLGLGGGFGLNKVGQVVVVL